MSQSFNELVEKARVAKSIDELFEIWKDAHIVDDKDTVNKNDECEVALNSFYEDGIVNEEKFNNSKIKMLFITNEVSIKYKEKDKETNEYVFRDNLDNQNNRNLSLFSQDKSGKMLVGDNAGNTCYSFEEFAKGEDDDTWSSKMRIKFGEMYRIAADASINSNREAVNYISFINLNKRGGFGFINRKVFSNYIERYQEFIKREIELINPDIIIWCAHNTFRKKYLCSIFGKDCVIWKESVVKILGRDVQVIKMRHPSCRKSTKEYLDYFKILWENIKGNVSISH